MSLNEEEFQALLARAKTGNQDSLLELILSYQAVLGQFVAKQIGAHLTNFVNEDDILQESFVEALKSIREFNGTQPVAFVAWLKAIATNRVRDAARKLSTAKRGGGLNRVVTTRDRAESRAVDLINELSADGYTPSYFAARKEAVNAIHAAIIVLPEDQREAIQLHCFEKLSLEQTAERLGRSRDSVRGLIQRGKQSLRLAMQTSSKWFSRK